MMGFPRFKARRLRGSIKYRLMFWGLALLAVALVLNIVAGSIYTRRGMQESAAELQAEVASSMARRIQTYLAGKIERLEDRAAAMTFFPVGGGEQRLLAMSLMKSEPAFGEVAVLNERGIEVLKFSATQADLSFELQSQAASAVFLASSRGETYIGPVLTSSRAEPYVTLGVPVKYGRRVAGVLIAQASLKFLWDVVREAKFGHDGYAYLVNESGLLIAHPDASLILKYPNLHNVTKVRQFLSTRRADGSPAEEGVGISGQSVLSSYAPLPDLGWAVVVEEPLDLFMADLQRLQRYAMLLLAVGLFSGAAVIVWVSRRITKPIQELRAGVETIRGGDLNHRTAIDTGDEIQELAEEFNQMAAALQESYATLEHKVEQRTKEAAALYEIATTVNQSLDLQTILQAVLAKITEIFDFETTRVFLLDRQRRHLDLRAAFDARKEECRPSLGFAAGEGVVGRVAETGEPLIFEDIYADSRYVSFTRPRAPASAVQRPFYAVFPIKTQARVFGTIAFHGAAPRQLTGDEVRLLTSMAEHLGVAVEKANLFKEVQTRSQHLAVLHTVSEAVSQSLNLEVVLRAAVEKIAETLGFDACWIYLLEPSGEELELKASKGLTPEMFQTMLRRKLTVGVSGLVFQTGERLVFEDIHNDERYARLTATGSVQSLGFVTSAAFPIRAKDAVNGTLHVVNRVVRRFTAEELQLLEAVAHEIGVAVENARLFAEVNEKTSALARANDELQEATRAKSEFIAAMSHELRTPLNIIIGNSDLTRDGFFGELNTDQRSALQKISRHARVLLKMINDVLTLSRHDAKKMSLDVDTVQVNDIIAHARTHVEQMNRDNHLEVRWDIDESVPPIVTDPLKLEEILQNLIGNAFKFTMQGRIEVKVRDLRGQNRVQFTIADTGVGIDSEDLEKIFNEFEQMKGAHTGGFNGVGLGLSIVKKYLDLMQGEIRVESQPGEGSTFTFSLPHSVSPDA